MKKVLFGIALLAVLMISCNKKYRFYGFDLSKSIHIPVPMDVSEIDTVFEIEFFIDNVFETHDTKAELVEQITIEEVSVNANGYNHFSELKFYISTETQQEAVLARNDTVEYVYNPIGEGSSYKLNVTESPMDEYIKESKIKIRVLGDLPMPLNISSSADAEFRFRVLTYIK